MATIQISETEELASYLNEVVIYNKDNSYTEYAGQAVSFTLSLADGSQVEIIACLLYTSTGAMGMAQANDSVSKNIQNQIANAQQKLPR